MKDLNSETMEVGQLVFSVLDFVNALLDLADLFGNGNLLRTDFCAFPQGLASPRTVLVIQQVNSLFRRLIS